MNFTQLKAFHALAITGGFTKAADYLCVSQPAVTTQLKMMEEAYGVALFHRRGHKLEFTETGKALFESSKKVFYFLDEAEEILTSESELQAGTLRVGSDNPFFIMDVLSTFKLRYPNVKVEVNMGSQAKILAELNGYEIDVAVITHEGGLGDYIVEPFSPLSLMLLLPLDHHLAGHSSISLADIADQPIVAREPGSITRKILFNSLNSIGLKPNVVLELNNQVAVREAIAAGLGIGAELDGGMALGNRLIMVPIDDVPVAVQEYVVCRRDRGELHKNRAFFEVARQIAPVLSRVQRLTLSCSTINSKKETLA